MTEEPENGDRVDDAVFARAFADAAAVMIHHSFDMVSIYDANANFAFASPSHERVLGYSPDELIGTSPVDLLHPDEREIVSQAFAEQLLVDRATGARRAPHPPSGRLVGLGRVGGDQPR